MNKPVFSINFEDSVFGLKAVSDFIWYSQIIYDRDFKKTGNWRTKEAIELKAGIKWLRNRKKEIKFALRDNGD